MEIWEPKPRGTLWATQGLLRDSFPPTFAIAVRLRQLCNSYETVLLNLTLLKFDYGFHFWLELGQL